MRIGQKSFVRFLGQVGASVIAFLATLYFARVLGAEAIGVYSVVVALSSWIKLPTVMGIGGAIKKRVSEGNEQSRFLGAGALLLGGLSALVSLSILVASPLINDYVGFPATKYVVGIVLSGTVATYIRASLDGHHLVHITGVLSPIEVSGQNILKVALVFASGLGVAGMLLGHIMGTVLIALLGIYVLPSDIRMPRRRHFKRLLSYAQFSWLTSVRSKVFNWMDIIILGFFVSSSLVGIYSVSWTMAAFLGLFSNAIRTSLFPEISMISTQKSLDAVGNIVETNLAYTGLILVPGFLGGAVLGDKLLRIYGAEFVTGRKILVLLIVAYLVHSYGKQMINTLNGVDRPDLAFRVSLAYILVNFTLNVALVYAIGWVGAALATLVSAGTGLVVSFYYLRRLLEFQLPIGFVAKQWACAGVMAVVVYALRTLEESYRLVSHNVLTVFLLVGVGAGIYFLLLLGLSARFRRTVRNNVPIDVPV